MTETDGYFQDYTRYDDKLFSDIAAFLRNPTLETDNTKGIEDIQDNLSMETINFRKSHAKLPLFLLHPGYFAVISSSNFLAWSTNKFTTVFNEKLVPRLKSGQEIFTRAFHEKKR